MRRQGQSLDLRRAMRRAMCDAPPKPAPAMDSRPLPRWQRLLNAPFIAGIWAYRYTLSPLVGRYCRFTPTCSQYAPEAYRTLGPWQGTRLTLWRLLRCQPLAKGGYDPVPLPRTTGRLEPEPQSGGHARLEDHKM